MEPCRNRYSPHRSSPLGSTPDEGEIVDMRSLITRSVWKGPHDETAIISLLFASGATAEILTSVLFDSATRFEVYGAVKRVICEDTLGDHGGGQILLDDSPLEYASTNPYVGELQDFVSAVNEHRDPEVPGEEGLRNVESWSPLLGPYRRHTLALVSFPLMAYSGRHGSRIVLRCLMLVRIDKKFGGPINRVLLHSFPERVATHLLLLCSRSDRCCLSSCAGVWRTRRAALPAANTPAPRNQVVCLKIRAAVGKVQRGWCCSGARAAVLHLLSSMCRFKS